MWLEDIHIKVRLFHTFSSTVYHILLIYKTRTKHPYQQYLYVYTFNQKAYLYQDQTVFLLPALLFFFFLRQFKKMWVTVVNQCLYPAVIVPCMPGLSLVGCYTSLWFTSCVGSTKSVHVLRSRYVWAALVDPYSLIQIWTILFETTALGLLLFFFFMNIKLQMLLISSNSNKLLLMSSNSVILLLISNNNILLLILSNNGIYCLDIVTLAFV